MFLQFFTSLREAQVPVTLREYLTLMEALDADIAEQSVENFYYLSRAALVKDERNLDKFDRVFGSVFKGLENLLDAMDKAEIPEEWLRKLAEKYLTEEEKKQIEAMGWDKLMETLKKRLEEQKGRHQGGSKWIGTAGTSPFGGDIGVFHRVQQALEPLEHGAEHAVELVEIALVLHQRGARQIVEVLHRLVGEVGVQRLHQRQIFAQGHGDLRVAQRGEELQKHGL